MKAVKGITAMGLVALAVALLVNSAAIGEGIRRGLTVSAGVLIPSLFPFMVLSGFVSATEYGRILSAPLGPVTEKLFKLPRELGFVVLFSMVGGYPVGAKMVSGLLEEKRIGKETAERMLCFCVNAGPPFLITAVGTGMFLDRRAGLILFGTQIVATVLTGSMFSLGERIPAYGREAHRGVEPKTAFVRSVVNGAQAMIQMCAFAVLFSGLQELLASLGVAEWLGGVTGISPSIIETLLAGTLEVTTGTLFAARVGGSLGFGMASAFVSFGGISVLFQILSFFKETPVRIRRFLLSRVVHGGISCGLAVPLYRVFCKSTAVWASVQPVMVVERSTWATSICLLGMCTILALSAGSLGESRKNGL